MLAAMTTLTDELSELLTWADTTGPNWPSEEGRRGFEPLFPGSQRVVVEAIGNGSCQGVAITRYSAGYCVVRAFKVPPEIPTGNFVPTCTLGNTWSLLNADEAECLADILRSGSRTGLSGIPMEREDA
jgi:hypothetical protein